MNINENNNNDSKIEIPELDINKHIYIGDKDGIIKDFSKSFIRIPLIVMNILNQHAENYINQIASIGENNSAAPLLYENGYYLGFNIVTEILNSDEWKEYYTKTDTENEQDNSDDKLHRIKYLLAIINTLGLGKWSINEYSKSHFISMKIINPIEISSNIKNQSNENNKQYFISCGIVWAIFIIEQLNYPPLNNIKNFRNLKLSFENVEIKRKTTNYINNKYEVEIIIGKKVGR